MSVNADSNENKNNNNATPQPQVVFVQTSGAYPYYPAAPAAGSAPTAPYFLPQTTNFVPLPTTPLNQSGCSTQTGGCRMSSWCSRWSGHGQGGCCNKVDPRPVGEFSHFLGGLALGTFFPIVGPILVGAMETSQLAGLGSFYGTLDILLVMSFAFLHAAPFTHHGLYIAGGIFLFISLIMALVGCCKTRRVLRAYETAVTKDPIVALPVISEEGKRCQYVVSCLISFFLPVIGTIPRVIFSRSLLSRFGSIKGLAWFFVVMGAWTGTPILLPGLFMIQISNIHFRRALISVSTKNIGSASA